MIDAIAQLLTSILLFLHATIVPDWGWAILVLTLLVRAAIWPLTRAQVESMKKMQALAPQMKELEVKYKDDPEKKAQETLRIYTANKINPLSGCLPVLIQMPVLIGMFVALRDPRFTKQLPGFDNASFFGMRLIVKPLEMSPFPEIERIPGMFDLAQLIAHPFMYDRFLYLPAMGLFVLYIVSSWFYSKQMQAQSAGTMDANQKMMSNMMMFMLLYFGLIFPVGLLLYFVVSNFVQMIQQQLTPSAVPATAVAEASVQDASGAQVAAEVLDPSDPKTSTRLRGKRRKPAPESTEADTDS